MKKEKLSLREKSVSNVFVKLVWLFVFLFLFGTLSGCGPIEQKKVPYSYDDREDRIVLVDRNFVSSAWINIYVDTETNIQYVSVFNGSAESGLTILCDTNGLPLIHEGEVIPYE